MTDARLEAAQRTNQGGERGWDFAPAATSSRRYPVHLIRACGQLACILGIIAVAWIVLARFA